MTFDPAVPLKFVQSTLSHTGYFSGGCLVGEPFSPPNDLSAAIFCMELATAQASLSSTIDVWTVAVRIYSRVGMTPEDAETVELSLAKGIVAVEIALAGAFTLGGTVRAIDWTGEEAGRHVVAKWGHMDVAGTIFRVVECTVPLIVDDSAQFAA